MLHRTLASAFVICVALSACGGGNSSTSSLPSTPLAKATSAAAQSVTVSIHIPSAQGAVAAFKRHPLYVSQNTQSAVIAVNGGTGQLINLSATSGNCTPTTGSGRTCNAAISAQPGTDTITETLYANTLGTGSPLAQSTTSATIVPGKANVVSITLDGVIASIGLSLASNPTLGTKASIQLIVTANDASGAAIVGGDPYTSAIALTDSDASGATSLSTQSVTSPAATVTIAYTGASVTNATFAASAAGATSGSVAFTPQQTSGTVTFNDYTTFGYNNQRNVYNPNSTALTPSTLSNLHLAWQASMNDYNTQTQPILATEISGHTGVLFVGGGSGNLEAYDALSGAQMWQRSLGQETYTCENNSTIYFGVGGSVAYDPSSASLYVVGNSNPSPDAIATNTLYHLDAAHGATLGSVSFAPPDGVSSLDFSHTSVTLGSNGLAYVGTGATCDISSWRGRVAAISVPSMTLAKTFYTVWDPNNSRGAGNQPWGGGGVWGWGGVSLDYNGNVLTGVGNTDNGSTNHGSIQPPFVAAPEENSGYGEALLALSPDLSTVQASHHPVPTSLVNGASVDLDLAGTPAIFQPNGAGCDPMAAAQGKSGTVYIYDETRIGSGPVGQFQLAPSTYSDGFLGGPAYSPATGLLYVAVSSSNESLFAPGMVAINPGCGSPSIAWHAAFGPDSYAPGSLNNPGAPRSVPAVSAGGVVLVGTICTPSGNGCGATTASAIARSTQSALRKPLICCAPPGTGGGALWALDASTGAVLNNGNPLIITTGSLRAPPTIDGNWVYVLDYSGNLYGLTLDPNYTAINTTARRIDPRTLKQWENPRTSAP